MSNLDLQPVLRPADIVALGTWLHEHHFHVDPSQLVAATALLSGPRQPAPPAELGPWLAPIFCTSRSEQEAFPRLYDDWLSQRGFAPQQALQEKTKADADKAPKPPGKWPLWPVAAGLLTLLLLCLGWFGRGHETLITVHGDGRALAGASIQTHPIGQRGLSDARGRYTVKYRHWDLPFTVTATHPDYKTGNDLSVARADVTSAQVSIPLALKSAPRPEPASVPVTGAAVGRRIDGLAQRPAYYSAEPLASTEHVVDPYAVLVCTLFCLVPLGFWLFDTARRRGFLERLPSRNGETRRRMMESATPALPAYSSDLRYLSREMRRRKNRDSHILDIASTLSATLRRGGLPQPVFGSRVEPEYLILVDCAGAMDHQSKLCDQVIHSFVAQGVSLERYEFDGDPRFAIHAPFERGTLHSGPQSLEQLFARHRDALIILFTDGSGLIDQYTGQPASWVKSLQSWSVRIMITPQPRQLWATREWLLAGEGVTILPLDGDGLHMMGDILRHEKSWPGVSPDARYRQRRAYQRDIDLLLDRTPLKGEQLECLLNDLAADLGEDGMAWLAGCAVYPEIHWAITLTVGDAVAAHYGSRSGSAQGRPSEVRDTHFAHRLAQLARLPWLRRGFMPDWLRIALLHRMSPELERAVRTSLSTFLASMKEAAPGQLQKPSLQIALGPRRMAWKDALDGVRAWHARRPKPETVNDVIFLKMMSGSRPPLAVDAGEALMRLLYRKGAVLAGPRSWPMAFGLAAAIAAAYYLPLVSTRTQYSGGTLIVPAPTRVALNLEGTQLASLSSEGVVTLKSVADHATGIGNSRTCSTTRLPIDASALSIDFDGTYVARHGRPMRALRVTDSCELEELGQDVDQRPLHADRNGQQVTPAGAPPDDILCQGLDGTMMTSIARRFANEALLQQKEIALACAYASARKAVLIATRSGKLIEVPVGGQDGEAVELTGAPGRDVPVTSLAVSGTGNDVAALKADGSVWILQGREGSWTSLGELDARAPLAMSGSGQTIAFATPQRGVEVWRLAPTSTQDVALGPFKITTIAPPAIRVPEVTLPEFDLSGVENGLLNNDAIRKEINGFIDEMVQRHDFDRAELSAMFAQTRYVDSAVELISPATTAKPKDWASYRAINIEPQRIYAGVNFWRQHAALLARAEKLYGVPAEIIVGIIGIESMYGRDTGRFRVIDALTTLAFAYPDTRNRASRMTFFRSELENTLLLARKMRVDPFTMRGSYSGAVGMAHFMPGSVLNYGVDHDRDGRIDAHSAADAIGSVANFLAQAAGWRRELRGPMVYPAHITQDNGWQRFLDQGLMAEFRLDELRAAGISSPADATPDKLYGLIALENGANPPAYWLATQNFFAITRYNRSYFYAMSVVELSEAVKAAGGLNFKSR